MRLRHFTLKKKQLNKSFALLPVWGIISFILLYIIATFLYPGGSDANKTTEGFSWQHNYWCELMASQAQNGKINTAKPVAITAMFVLAISLIVFWYCIPGLFGNNGGSKLIRYCGIGSMLILPLMFAGLHDTVMNVAGLLGCIAIAVLLTRLYHHKMYGSFIHGILCILLCAANNYIYYTGNFFYWLPIIQKISFIVFLLWFIMLTIKLSKTIATRNP